MLGWRLFFIILLLILGAFLVLAEFAVVRVRPTQLEALIGKDPRAQYAVEIQLHLHSHLSSILVGISLCAVGFGALGERVLTEWLVSWIKLVPGSDFIPWASVSPWLGAAVALLVMTTVNVVLTEMVPRSFAIRNSTAWALRTAKPLLFWSRLARPLTFTLTVLSSWVERLFGLPPTEDLHEDPLPSEEEFKRLLVHSQEKGELDLNKADLIENVFSFSKRTTIEIAIPRGNVVTMDLGKSFRENMDALRALKHSRIPLIDGDLDNVKGVIHLKDVLWKLQEGGEPDLRALARPAFFVPEMRLIQDLLLDFQRKRQHMALVVNEHGGVDGIVTLEDVIEELVGEIHDEFDQETSQIMRANQGSWLALGNVTLEKLKDEFGLALEEETDSVTLGGYFQEQLGRVLRVGDEMPVHGWQIKVLEMNGMAPGKFLLIPLEPEPRSGSRCPT